MASAVSRLPTLGCKVVPHQHDIGFAGVQMLADLIEVVRFGAANVCDAYFAAMIPVTTAGAVAKSRATDNASGLPSGESGVMISGLKILTTMATSASLPPTAAKSVCGTASTAAFQSLLIKTPQIWPLNVLFHACASLVLPRSQFMRKGNLSSMPKIFNVMARVNSPPPLLRTCLTI